MSATPSSNESRLHLRTGLLVGLLLFIIAARLVPYVLYRFGMNIDPGTTLYPWNLSPLGALCLFGGARFADRRLAYAIPLVAILISNLGIWAITGRLDWAFDAQVLAVFIAFTITVTMGLWLRDRQTMLTIGGTALASEVVFFLFTNFFVWKFGTIYPPTSAGLSLCYIAAIPFFRNSLISMAVFGTVLFSSLAVVSDESSGLEVSPLPAAR